MCTVWLWVAVPVALGLIGTKWWGFPGRRQLSRPLLQAWWVALLIVVVAVVYLVVHCGFAGD